MARLVYCRMKLTPCLMAVVASIMGCSSGDITNPNQIVFPATNVSFKGQVAPYFALSCNFTGCHDGSANTAGGVDLSSWIGVRATNVTQPKDTNSELVLVMYGRAPHSHPFSANDNQRIGIKQWVREGAQNN